MTEKKRNHIRRNLQAYGFLSPFLILVSLLYILPAILTIIMAFTDLDSAFIWEFVGLKNFKRIFKDPNTIVIIKNTFLYVGITIIFTICLQLFFSTLTTYFIRDEKKGSFFKALLMIPMITPTVVYSVLWIWFFDASETGAANQLLHGVFGLGPVNWIADYPFQIVIFAQLLTSVAYGTTIYSSAIKSIPENQFKEARVDGAGELEIFKHIILPNLKPHISFILLWESLGLLTNYTAILLITDGGPGIKTEVWALSAYHKAFGQLEYGYGSAISLLLIFVVAVIMCLLLAMSDKSKKEVAPRE